MFLAALLMELTVPVSACTTSWDCAATGKMAPDATKRTEQSNEIRMVISCRTLVRDQQNRGGEESWQIVVLPMENFHARESLIDPSDGSVRAASPKLRGLHAAAPVRFGYFLNIP